MKRVATSLVVHTSLLAIACSPDPPREHAGREHAPHEPSAPSPCTRAFGEKLGVPFVRVCPEDLPGIVTAPFWIAAAPIGCTGGEHETVLCLPVLALAPTPAASGSLSSGTALVVDAALAHRTCMLRFGGRLPTAAERVWAREALGAATVIVGETDHPPERSFLSVSEWTTATACVEPSTLGGCALATFPRDGVVDVAWPQLRTCDAAPSPATGALVVEPDGEPCPIDTAAAAPPCLLAAARGKSLPRYRLSCRTLTKEQAVHPEPATTARATFRCVVSDAALVGTISR